MGARSIHPFPARMAPEIALDAIPDAEQSQLLVLDPMCGSGTVLSAAVARGQRAVGVDIDPLAVLMSSVATAAINHEELDAAALAVVVRARTEPGAAPWSDPKTQAFVDFWFAPTQRDQLIAISSAIAEVEDVPLRNVLRVALSRIIVTKTPQASLAADTSHSRPHRVISTSEYDVFVGFSRSVRSLAKLLRSRVLAGQADVVRGDSRTIENVADHEVDLLVTSPPYLNALDYMRGHKMALVWFGWSIDDLRHLRGNSIGAERAPDSTSSPAVLELVDFVKRDVQQPDSLPLRTLERFAADMSGFASAARRVVAPGGKAILVVGNSTLRGNYIRNATITQYALEAQGFVQLERYERDIPATSRYMAINTATASSMAKRMRTEVVLTMESR